MTGAELEERAKERKLIISIAKAMDVLLDIEFQKMRQRTVGDGSFPIFEISRRIGAAKGELDYDLKALTNE